MIKSRTGTCDSSKRTIVRIWFENKFINIITKTTLDESPTRSPNGHIIMYSTTKDEQGYLAGITVDKKSKFQLPVKLGSIREPAWSPFLN